MLYQYFLALALLAGSGSAAGLVRRQAETPFTTVVTVTVDAAETDRPLICPCPTSISVDLGPTSRLYTLPVTSPSLAVAKKRQDPYTTTITENLPGTSVIVLTATCTCPISSGGNTTPTTAPTTVSAATLSTMTAAPSASTIRASSPASTSTSSALTGAAQGNGATSQNFRGARTFGAAAAAMVAGAAFLALVA
ncbi:hypothetical protein FS837_007256 [Tulasnella sp. UAMH 9824]|nr:hypothetical protein FS837_007256 [Tulasnella sp. UAMH 9824]